MQAAYSHDKLEYIEYLTNDLETSGWATASIATDDGRMIHVGLLSLSVPCKK
jgi:hypothetical protein